MIVHYDSLLARCSWAMGVMILVWSCQSRSVLPEHLQHLEGDLPDEVSYNFHIKPILSDRCFNCHGPDAENREADLRLDIAEWAYGRGEHASEKTAVLPYDAEGSELYRRILTDDPEIMMPPTTSKLAVSDYEKALLIKWIDQGAEYADHWSFAPVMREEVSVGRHPVDHFITAKLSEQDLVAQAPASAEHRIRRLSFDLTGLPPSLEDVDEFVKMQDADTYEALVEKYLSSPAYGERMATMWMDVSRYADSDGYLDDKHRDFTPWRDWVIQSFNKNMPYDQFATWQLAGDLIDHPTPESILATAFNRLHRKNSEAGIVFEEYRVEYVADRAHTFGKAFLGLTTECARCHDHKYDPISQKEYYELFAFFNSTDEMGTAIYGPDQTPGPSMLLSTKEQRDILEFLEKEITEKEGLATRTLAEYGEEIDPKKVIDRVIKDHRKKMVAHYSFDQIISGVGGKMHMQNQAAPGRATLHEPQMGEGYSGDGFYVNDYGSVQLGDKEGWYDRDDPFTVSLWVKPAEAYPEAGIFSHCEDMRLGYKGYSMHLKDNRPRFIIAHSWPFNSIEVVGKSALPVGEWTHLVVSYDGSSAAPGVRIYLNGKLQEVEVMADHLYKGILFEHNIHTYGFHGFKLGYRDKIKNLKGGGLDEVRIFSGVLSQAEIYFDLNVDAFSKQAEKTAKEIFADHMSENNYLKYQLLQDSIQALRQRRTKVINEIPEIMVMGDSPVPRTSYLLQRGSYAQRGEEVYPNTPASIAPEFGSFEKNRLGLAEWMFDADNPLTARVFVNRIWQQHFGRGLVRTSEDFGAQGALPSHPELLDYLANYFREADWDIQALHRLIVTSAAYQRSAVVSEDHLSKDPENVYYARGPSQRLTAEMIRDNALELSDLLVARIGGESEYPYQPAGLWDEISNKSWRYPYLQEPGEGLYRRSLYTIWKRTAPPPSMLIFDAPDRSFCTVQRTETNTPLQALVLLNDPQYVEAARVIASKTMDTHDALEDQLKQVARLAWGRHPDQYELDQLETFYNQEKENLQRDKSLIWQYLENGEVTVGADQQLDDLVALSKTTHGLLNTYEAQMKK